MTTAFPAANVDSRLDAIFGHDSVDSIVTPGQLGLHDDELPEALVGQQQRITRRDLLRAIAVGSAMVAAAPLLVGCKREAEGTTRPLQARSSRKPHRTPVQPAPEKARKAPSVNNPTPLELEEGQEQKLAEALTYVHPAYTSRHWETMRDAYVAVLRSQDVDAWRQQVEKEGTQRHRVSFPAEYTAYGNAFTARPVEGLSAEPAVSNRYGSHILAFSPDRDAATGSPLPEQYRNRKYLLIRGPVPRENNPYAVLTAKYLRGFTVAQVRALVEDYKRKW